ncbi:alcohol dehydrogenase catalytic domain-containing protein [Sphingopyxis sp. CCNWLW253]|uniref:alcohol dehydrogenase catalytic domain-containing protein n=1 Tax=unclassified Sphingopyxis TaxID=2614943 RepID=UPI003012C6C8
MVELPDPGDPGPGQVRLRMAHAPVNPADLLSIKGNYAFALDAALPFGAEGVGIVEAVGAGVSDTRTGQLALPLLRGNWCRVRVMDRQAIMPVPAGIDPVRAARLRINPATASLLLDASGCRSGDIVAQNAAGSSVARWVRYFAAQRGIAVIDIVRRPDPDVPGAIIDGPELAGDILRATDGRRVSAALDCVAGSATDRLARAVAPKGRVLIFGHLSGEPVSISSQLLTGGSLSVTGFSLRPAESELDPGAMDRMFETIFAAELGNGPDLTRETRVPLSQAGRAITLARDGGAGRILLDLAQ